MGDDWRVYHRNVIVAFLNFLNAHSRSFVLKGGTALMLCYSLDRFSEDIDLDAADKGINIVPIIDQFCKGRGIEYRVAKDTNYVKRCSIAYGGFKPLKVEVSYRRNGVSIEECTFINGYLVYTIQTLAVFKLHAYLGRDRVRDLYDIVFIFKRYTGVLSSSILQEFEYAIAEKGIEYFDYLIRTQHDDLIDSGKLEEDFLNLYYSLGFE